MTLRLYPAALIGLALVMGACSDDGREMKLPTDNQNESIMTTTLAPDDQGSFDTAAPETDLDDHGSETELLLRGPMVLISRWNTLVSVSISPPH